MRVAPCTLTTSGVAAPRRARSLGTGDQGATLARQYWHPDYVVVVVVVVLFDVYV